MPSFFRNIRSFARRAGERIPFYRKTKVPRRRVRMQDRLLEAPAGTRPAEIRTVGSSAKEAVRRSVSFAARHAPVAVALGGGALLLEYAGSTAARGFERMGLKDADEATILRDKASAINALTDAEIRRRELLDYTPSGVERNIRTEPVPKDKTPPFQKTINLGYSAVGLGVAVVLLYFGYQYLNRSFKGGKRA